MGAVVVLAAQRQEVGKFGRTAMAPPVHVCGLVWLNDTLQPGTAHVA